MIAPFSTFISSKKVSGFVAILLASLLAYQLALLTWALLPEEQSQRKWVLPKINTQLSSQKVETTALQKQHLFGKQLQIRKPNKPVSTVSNAPKTKLNLTLVGVVAASNPLYSSAIIASSGSQDSYFIDSKIAATNATISEIHQDRVILSVNGQLQTLMLDGVEAIREQKKKTSINREVKKQVENKSVKVLPLDRELLLNNPGRLTDYIGISPVREDGEIVGYRVRPGRDSRIFTQSGLKNGDLAIELNGVDLTDTQQTFELMKEFSTMTDINLTIEREGQLHEFSFSIP